MRCDTLLILVGRLVSPCPSTHREVRGQGQGQEQKCTLGALVGLKASVHHRDASIIQVLTQLVDESIDRKI